MVGVGGEGEEVEEVGYGGGGCVVAAEDEEFHLWEGGGCEGFVVVSVLGRGGLEFGVGEVDDGFTFLGIGRRRGRG